MTFTLKLFKGATEDIEIGEGTTALTVSSGNTVKGEIVVKYSGPDMP